MQEQTLTSEASPRRGNVHESEYTSYLERTQARFTSQLATGPLFTSDAEGLWDAYLGSFPAADRQYHNCGSCRRFIEAYGGLVVIDENGTATPAVWDTDDVQGADLAAVAAMERIVRRAKVTGPFLSKEACWGFPITGDWAHLSVLPPSGLHFKHSLLTAGQAMAEKREEFGTVSRALSEYSADAVNQALALLKSDALFRSEKVLGQAQWLSDLHAAIAANQHRRANIVWRFVALAPAGFCHPRSSMIGTLLDDIIAGVSFDEASRKFRVKMDPLHYQRPQAAPSAGNIAAAEKLVEKLGIGPSLVRRFARLDEIETIWRPTPAPEAVTVGGVFGHLKSKGATPAPSMSAPPQTMTWAKFSSSVLPGAKSIEALIPHSGNFTAILTAENIEAPPILQWDSAERRNPCSTYVYHRGSPASQWGLLGGKWQRVTAIALQPQQWFGGDHAHQGKGAVVVLDGAKDSKTGQGNALFPETLKGELREIKATVEAYSRTSVIQGADQASACGLGIGSGAVDVQLRVTDGNDATSTVRIDRWD